MSDEILSQHVSSITRAAIFDWLAHLVSNGKYEIDLNLAAHKTIYALYKQGILPVQPPENIHFEDLYRHGVPRNIISFITQTLWELHLQGVLSPAPAWISAGNGSAIVTPYGREVLADASGRIQTHDPDGYLNYFWSTNPLPDPEMMLYVKECIYVFQGGHLFACVVLLGIASERLMTVLAESLRDALGDPVGVEWFQRKYNKEDASGKFKALINQLLANYDKELEKERLKDALQGIVRLTFETIRHARNDIAHPKGRELTWNEVSGFLHNFVQYFRYINKIIVLLENSSKN